MSSNVISCIPSAVTRYSARLTKVCALDLGACRAVRRDREPGVRRGQQQHRAADDGGADEARVAQQPQVRHAGGGQRPGGEQMAGREDRDGCRAPAARGRTRSTAAAATRAWLRPQPEPRAIRVGAQDEDERADDRQELREAVGRRATSSSPGNSRAASSRDAPIRIHPRNPAEDVGPPAIEVEQGEQSRHEERGDAGERAHVDDASGRRDRLRALGVPRRRRCGSAVTIRRAAHTSTARPVGTRIISRGS